ncbi:hypothetical protein BRARA_G01238 [Brassica rapa]|uniref:Secreted protein n=1 Tax=Brassica campestris TaxID=3711 RepID=A0A397YKA5_BRACM|nr:hypothetical protein BRARA_G01238 [Brassica rapa]
MLNDISALSLSSLTLLLISLPSSSAITFLTTASISDLVIASFESSALTAIPSSSLSNAAFIFCSAKSGHAIIGTPLTTPSSVEFQPQCVKNPPTAL